MRELPIWGHILEPQDGLMLLLQHIVNLSDPPHGSDLISDLHALLPRLLLLSLFLEIVDDCFDLFSAKIFQSVIPVSISLFVLCSTK